MKYYQLKNKGSGVPFFYHEGVADSINKQIKLVMQWKLYNTLTLKYHKATLRLASRLHRT
jgi:hypothetical protein